MPEQSAPTDAPLQFDSAHPGEAPTAICTSCSEPIRSVYHEANGSVVCSRCRGKLEVLIASTGGMRRFRRAVGFGLGAALGCGALYGAFRAYSEWDFSLIAILVGLAVGKAVFVGAERRGGRRYQVLAALLTYFAIAASYVPIAIQESRSAAAETADSPKATPVGFVGSLIAVGSGIALVFALPIIVGMASIMSVIFLALGLLQAWRMNKAVVVNVSGPYRLVDPTSSAEPATT